MNLNELVQTKQNAFNSFEDELYKLHRDTEIMSHCKLAIPTLLPPNHLN